METRRILAVGLLVSSIVVTILAGILKFPTLFLVGLIAFAASFPISHYILTLDFKKMTEDESFPMYMAMAVILVLLALTMIFL